MWWSSYAFCPFPLLFFVLLVLFLIGRIFWFRRCGSCGPWRADRLDTEAILKRRLANGQITESDYVHLKELLNK